MHQTKHRVYGYCKSCLYLFQMIRWNRRKIRAVEYLGGRCMRCGFQGHPITFDFDHRVPADKQFDWNKLRLRAWDAVKAELDKCDLLCSNCHRLRHMNPALWPDLPVTEQN